MNCIYIFYCIAILYHIIACNSQLRFTPYDPTQALIIYIAFAALTLSFKRQSFVYLFTQKILLIANCAVLGTFYLLIDSKALPHFNILGYQVGIAISILGITPFILSHYVQNHDKILSKKIVLPIIILAMSYVLIQSGKCGQNDGLWYQTSRESKLFSVFSVLKMNYQMTSQYVEMSDRVELAVDVYLPNEPQQRQKPITYPTVIVQTRYNRDTKVTWPMSLFFGEHTSFRTFMFIDKLIPAGYAFVVVDVRGTGASFGMRNIDLNAREQADLGEIIEWVLLQSWCNGKIGTTGISYDGMTAGITATLGKVQATALLFAPIDVYEETLAPGGVLNSKFIEAYAKFVKSFEQNEKMIFPEESPFFMNFFNAFQAGVQPVGNDEAKLKAAIAQHELNFDVWKFCDSNLNFFKDSLIKQSDGFEEHYVHQLALSTDRLADRLSKLQVKTLIVGGYYDTRSAHSAFELGRQIRERGGVSQVVVGPFTHGACSSCSPWGANNQPCFDMYQLVLDHFDKHLKGAQLPKEFDEYPVQYFSFGHSYHTWKGAHQFPLADRIQTLTFHLAANQKLITNRQYSLEQQKGSLIYNVSKESSSGKQSRWNLIYSQFYLPTNYLNRKEQGQHSAVFESETFESDLLISGYPHLTLQIEPLDGSDAQIFVYLEEIDKSGRYINYITEGLVKMSHQCVNKQEFPSYQNLTCQRSFKKDDFQEFEGKRQVNIQLEPISYKFRKGHKIRISINGFDNDNFAHSTVNVAFQWRIYFNESFIELPIEP